MLLTISLSNKGSFLGSLINKCRPAAVANLSLSAPTYEKKTLEAKAGIPPKPKKPLTPFFRFMNEIRPKFQATNPELPITEVVKQISKEWKSTDAAIKKRLQEEFKQDMQKYLETRTKYDANLTDEQRLQLKELKKEVEEDKQRRILRRHIKEMGRPKKPASAFLRFAANERKANPQQPNETFREWQKKVTAKWGTLLDEQKKEYYTVARKEFEVYKKEIALWEEKMIRSGNIIGVRHNSLIDLPEPKPKKH